MPGGETGAINLKDIIEGVSDLGTKVSAIFNKGQEEYNPFMTAYRDWVNQRKASTVEGILKRREFSDLDAKGMGGIDEFQAGMKEGRFKDVQDYFDKKFEELTKAGVRVGYKENYLPQLWENPKAEVAEIQRRLGLKPKFSLPSVLENYQAGIALGLKPKFKTVGELMGWYEKTAQKSLADRQFFDFLKDNQLIQPQGRAPIQWKTLDPDHFPIQKFKGVKKEYTGVLKAPEDIAGVINNYLRDPSEVGGGVLQAMADAASVSKNVVLSSGLPLPAYGKGATYTLGDIPGVGKYIPNPVAKVGLMGTGINAHGANIMARNMMSRGVLRGGAEAAKYLIHPKSATKWLDENLSSAPQAVKDGLTLSVEEHSLESPGSTELVKTGAEAFKQTKLGKIIPGKVTDVGSAALNKVMTAQGKMFEDPLFQNVIPALKLKHYNQLVSEFMNKGMTREQAGPAAASATNDIYGGINWEAMAESRDFQNLLRASILAPDWFRTNLRMGKGMAQGVMDPKNPAGSPYRKSAANLVAAYVAANVANYASSGHLMVQNAPGHTLDIQLGKSGDKDRYIRPFGTAADFFRLPYDTAAATLRKDPDFGQAFAILANRMSVPAHIGTHLLTRTDHFGRPLTGKDAYGRPIPPVSQLSNILGEVSEMGTPQYVNSAVGLATGRLNTEQALLGGLEAPVRYATPPKPKKSRQRLQRIR